MTGNIFLCACGVCQGAFIYLFHVYHMFVVVQMTMSQSSLAAYFGSPVQPPPRVKCKDVVDTQFYFQFEDRLTTGKRHEAYNVQTACYTPFFECTNRNAV